MSTTPPGTDDLRVPLDEMVEGCRSDLRSRLDGLTEEQARQRLVPSKTTLLGLVMDALGSNRGAVRRRRRTRPR